MIDSAHSYSFQTLSVLSTLSLLNSLWGLTIDAAFGKKKSAVHALSSGWVAGTYSNLSHPGVGLPGSVPTPDSLIQ